MRKNLDVALKKRLSKARYQHSLGVQNTAFQLAKIYGADCEKAALAGLLHDWGKGMENDLLLKKASEFGIVLGDIERKSPFLLHGPIGAKLVEQELGIKDPEVLQAISLHTIGEEGMSLLDKIVYLADYIEPNRDFPGVQELRKISFVDLNKAIIKAIDHTLNFLIEKGALIHWQTVQLRNSLLTLEEAD